MVPTCDPSVVCATHARCQVPHVVHPTCCTRPPRPAFTTSTIDTVIADATAVTVASAIVTASASAPYCNPNPHPHKVCDSTSSTSSTEELYPSRKANSFLPWTKAGSQVWTLRTQKGHDDLRLDCATLGATAKEEKLTYHGLNTLDHAFVNTPGVQCVDCPMDVMHVECKGNLEVHLSGFMYMAVEILGWTTLEEINSRVHYLNDGIVCLAAHAAQRPPTHAHTHVCILHGPCPIQ